MLYANGEGSDQSAHAPGLIATLYVPIYFLQRPAIL